MTTPSTEMTQAPPAHTLPPRVKGLPVIGSLGGFLRDPYGFLRKAQADYGDIYTLDLGFLRWVVVNHPRHTDHLFVQNAHNYIKTGGFWDSMRQLLGNGLLVSEGDFWLRQRRMIQPHFHRQRLAALIDTMVTATSEGLELWDASAKSGQPIDVMFGCANMTMRIITSALFGQGLTNETIKEVGQAVDYVSRYVMLGIVTTAVPSWLPIPGAKRYQQMIDQLDRVVYDIIQKERVKSAEQRSNSMLAMLVQMVDEESGEGMTDKQLRDEVMTFFLAGYETTSLVLGWVFIYLMQNPTVMAQLQAEIDSVVGQRTPTFADLGALNYTRMVVLETTRIRPPAWWGPCTAQEDDEIDGYHIPAGTTVVNLTVGVQHHPDFWPEPDRFDPLRFTPEQIAQRHKLAWAPFGAGQRVCIGRDFSIMEAQIILAMIIQRYTLTVSKPPSTAVKFSTTMIPKERIRVTLTPRMD